MLYTYKTLTKEGQEQNGSIEALNKNVAISSLQQRGLTIVSIEASEKVPFLKNFKNKIRLFNSVPVRDVVIFSRQLSTLFLAQVSALRIFRLLAAESESPLLREKLSAISDDIQGGSSISSALEKHPGVFSDFYVNMVRVGEESGKLTDIFLKLADYLDRSYALTAKTRNALAYPIFVVATFTLVMTLLLTFVFPKLASILTESGQAIPLFTKIVIGVSDFLVHYGLFFLGLMVVGGLALWRFVNRGNGKMYIDRVKLELPFLGSLFTRLYLSRIADNLHIMLSSGISVTRALEITAASIGNKVYEDIIRKALEDVKGGSSLSDSFSGHKEIPGILVQIMKVGEETGELASILGMLSKFYSREVENAVDSLVALIEPALIVALAGGVGLILSSVLIPIYNIANGF